MGADCGLIVNRDNKIPLEKREEFCNRITELFYYGGMFQRKNYTLFGDRYTVIKRACMNEHEIYFDYNYFEDDLHETAGFDKDSFRVFSGKVSYSSFALTMLAAYALEGLYTPGHNAIKHDGIWFNSIISTSWINYLFNENYVAKGTDPWEIYLILKGTEAEKHISRRNLQNIKNTYLGYRGYIDIIAVKEGLEAAKKELSAPRKSYETDDFFKMREVLYHAFEFIYEFIDMFKQSDVFPMDKGIELLLSRLRHLYTVEKPSEVANSSKREEIKQFWNNILMLDAPATIIKIIAEIYQLDFWELWQRIADVARRTVWNSELLDSNYRTSTEEFFNVSTDDLVLYWTKDKPLSFSNAMTEWLAKLKQEYNVIIAQGVDMNSPIRRIKNMLDYGEEHYTHLYLFEDFLNESFENITNPNFMALWMVLEKVLHNPENLSASKGLFEPDSWHKDDADYAIKGYRICDSWWSVDKKLKFNSGRQNVRRYIALMANKELRKEIFGI